MGGVGGAGGHHPSDTTDPSTKQSGQKYGRLVLLGDTVEALPELYVNTQQARCNQKCPQDVEASKRVAVI